MGWDDLLNSPSRTLQRPETTHLSDHTTIDQRINKQPITRGEEHPLAPEGSGLAVCGRRNLQERSGHHVISTQAWSCVDPSPAQGSCDTWDGEENQALEQGSMFVETKKTFLMPSVSLIRRLRVYLLLLGRSVR